jgi:thiol:disulfide interchange protein DsbD
LSIRRFFFLLTCALLFALPPCARAGEDAETDHVQVRLIAEQQGVPAHGGTITIALRQLLKPEWHTYWRNPGDSGEPTAIVWTLPPGFSAGAIQWPYPQRIPVGPLLNFGYANKVLLLTDLRVPSGLKVGDNVTFSTKVTWLVCKDICLPGGATFSISLPVATGTAEGDRRWGPLLARARSEMPRQLNGWTADVSQAGQAILVRLRPPREGVPEIRRVVFFPAEDGIIENGTAGLTDGSGLLLFAIGRGRGRSF